MEGITTEPTPLIGKTLDYIIIYPYRDSATTSTLDTESLIFDNIFLSNTENSPIDLQEITTNNDQQYRQILDIDFEYLNSFVKVIPANSSINVFHCFESQNTRKQSQR